MQRSNYRQQWKDTSLYNLPTLHQHKHTTARADRRPTANTDQSLVRATPTLVPAEVQVKKQLHLRMLLVLQHRHTAGQHGYHTAIWAELTDTCPLHRYCSASFTLSVLRTRPKQLNQMNPHV